MKYTYNEIYKLAEYGRQGNGWIDYPVRLACKKVNPNLPRWDMDYVERYMLYS